MDVWKSMPAELRHFFLCIHDGCTFVAIIGAGGLAAVAIVGAGAAGGAGLGEVMSTMSWAPKEVTGMIAGICSINVFTNAMPPARAHLDMIMCSKHPGPPVPVATGSGQVYINGMPAARVDDKTGCGAVITKGSSNVFIGGGTVQTDTINPENLVPGWVHAALLVVGMGAAVVLAGPVIAVGGLVLGVASMRSPRAACVNVQIWSRPTRRSIEVTGGESPVLKALRANARGACSLIYSVEK